jgi:hypothetical protein
VGALFPQELDSRCDQVLQGLVWRGEDGVLIESNRSCDDGKTVTYQDNYYLGRIPRKISGPCPSIVSPKLGSLYPRFSFGLPLLTLL